MSWKRLALLLVLCLTALAQERVQARIPIILDTDLGDSIDDAMALLTRSVPGHDAVRVGLKHTH